MLNIILKIIYKGFKIVEIFLKKLDKFKLVIIPRLHDRI